MVEQYGVKHSFCLGRRAILAITAIVVAFSFSANFAFAAETRINSEEVERIKNALDIVKTASNFGGVLVDGGDFMKVLNTAIGGGQTATDVTYGLLVFSAINEMEFMDLVLSGKYKDEARDYFNSILDERTKLTSYWKGVGFDIPKVVTGKITSPIAALTLNTFEITDKAIQILTELVVLQKEKRYDGLWRYFDSRRGGEQHTVAWEDARSEMGGLGINIGGFLKTRIREENALQLEQQFAALYEKWGPYVTPFGISEEYKEQAKSDLRNTLARAMEENTEVGPLYAEKTPLWDRFLAQVENIKNAIANLVSKINPFSAGPIITKIPPKEPPAESPPVESWAEDGPPPILPVAPVPVPVSVPVADEQSEESIGLSETFSMIEEVEAAESTTTEAAVVESVTTTEAVPEEPAPFVIEPEEAEPESAPGESDSVLASGSEAPPISIQLCQKGDAGTPRQYRVLINEVAWMGNEESSNNEWIELKNIWGIPVNLAGWQLQDKGRQIKVIFEEGETIPAGGYYLLERTGDDSFLGALADKIYTGALGNTKESLYLFDNNCQLEDEVFTVPDWPGGDNYSKKTMQRFDVFNWYSAPVSAGSENSPPPTILVHPSAPAAEPVPASKPSYPIILITETRNYPLTERFIELYNPNDAEVSLTGWYIQRKTETGDSFNSFITSTQFEGKVILPRSYFLIARAAENADIILDITLTKNNTLVLKNPGRDITDEISTDSPSGIQSYGRKWSADEQRYLNEFEVQTPTPGAQNAGLNQEEGGGEEDEEDEEEDGEEGGGDGAGQAAPLSVVINEIAWMGTDASYNDEWIELYNNTDNDIDLTGWKLKKDNDEWINISSSTAVTTTISAHSYFLFERTDDTTVNSTSADQIYTGALSNNGATLELKDNRENLIDKVDSSDGWFAGENSTKRTMERIDSSAESAPNNWASNNGITRSGQDANGQPLNGTPKTENSVSKEFTELSFGRAFNEDFTLSRFGSPYIWQGSLIVGQGAKLTIEPGVEIKFKHSQFKVKGELEVRDAVFTSYSEEYPWDGIYFENSVSTLDNVIIRYAGLLHRSCCYEYVPYTYGAVHINGGRVEIKNSLIEKSDTFGLWLENSTSTRIINTEFKDNRGSDHNGKTAALYIENSSPTIMDSIFRNNKIGILAEGSTTPTIRNSQFIQNTTPIHITSLLADVRDNIFQDNGIDGVLVNGVGFSSQHEEIIWKENGSPYFINGLTIPFGYTLKIEPGVEIKIMGGYINVEGTMGAKGNAQNKIIFSGSRETPMSWKYIKFSASSTDSILENVVVRYGGFWDFWGSVKKWYGAVKIEAPDFIIKDSVFENNKIAIELIDADFAKQSKNITIQSNEVGIYVLEGDCPDLSEVSFGAEDTANRYDTYPVHCNPQN